MTDFRSLYDSNYLYSFDLKGRDVAVTIKEVKGAKVKGADGKEQRKMILYFKESHDGRGYVAPKSAVGKVIAGMHGNNIEDWPGKRITLFPTQCEAFGKIVDCIRVRPTVPAKTKAAGEFAEVADAPMPEAPDHAEVTEREPGDE
jgi:hypothetical protein